LSGDNDFEIVIVLSIFNGTSYLLQQIQSLKDLNSQNWKVLWRDDSSLDNSRALMQTLTQDDNRFYEIDKSGQHLGALKSYQTLVMASLEYNWGWLAFCDQDDIWLPNRFSAIQKQVVYTIPCMLIGNLVIIDEKGKVKKEHLIRRVTQSNQSSVIDNKATGCATAINPILARYFSEIEFMESTHILHDHVCYAISKFTGLTIFDEIFWTKYRLHRDNAVGMNNNVKKTLQRLLPKRGSYLNQITQMSMALQNLPNLSEFDKYFLNQSAKLTGSNFWDRLSYLRTSQLRRTTRFRTIYTHFKVIFNL
jgi:rhamnosyltransferase